MGTCPFCGLTNCTCIWQTDAEEFMTTDWIRQMEDLEESDLNPGKPHPQDTCEDDYDRAMDIVRR